MAAKSPASAKSPTSVKEEDAPAAGPPSVSKCCRCQSPTSIVMAILLEPYYLWKFVRELYSKFGGFVTVGILQYGVNQGFGNSVAQLAMRYFLMDVLGLASRPGYMQNLTAAAKIPWNIKPVMGLVSDAIPLAGYHRTSYIGLTALLGCMSYFALGILPLTAVLTVPFMIMINFSIATPDVMVDATAAVLSKDSPERASDLQSLVWGSLAVGSFIASCISGVLVKAIGEKNTFFVCMVPTFALVVASVLRCLPEERLPRDQRKANFSFLKKHLEITSLAACMSVITVTLAVLNVTVDDEFVRGGLTVGCGVFLAVSIYCCLSKVTPILAKIALFCFLRECCQPSLGDVMFPWMTKYEHGPKFSKEIMGALGMVGSIGLFAGVVIYNRYLTRVSYRKIFLSMQIIMVFYNLSDLILVNRWNLKMGIPDLIFVAGDDALGALVGRFFIMPLFVLCAKVCPDNIEATMFAMLMALLNFGSSISEFFGAAMADAFGVKDMNFDNLPNAVISKSFFRLLAIPLIFILVPDLSPDDPVPGAEPRGAAGSACETNPDLEGASGVSEHSTANTGDATQQVEPTADPQESPQKASDKGGAVIAQMSTVSTFAAAVSQSPIAEG